MSLLSGLPGIVEAAKKEYEETKSGDFRTTSKKGNSLSNLIVQGENLSFMKYLAEKRGLAGGIKLIYVDPPFFSGTNYQARIKTKSPLTGEVPAFKIVAYEDKWAQGMDEYLKMLASRLFMMKDLLSEDGCLWMHLDWHVVHYVKIIMDEIFGEKNFINEIIWHYKSGGTSKNHFSRKHDTLLFYGKETKTPLDIPKEKSYNRERKPYRFKGVKEYRDELGWYTMVNMKDVWHIDMVGRTSNERTGYATQKPEALLERIIGSCTKEGEICADFFCGAGTAAAVAQKLGRIWIACDGGDMAVSFAEKRLAKAGASFEIMKDALKERKTEGGIDIKIEIINTSFEGKKLIRTEITNYRPDIKNLPLEKEGRKIIKELSEKDSLSLIDYFSMDFDYDGEIHRSDVYYFKDRENECICCEKILKKWGKISIKVTDIFGNVFMKTLDLSAGAGIS